MNSIYSSLNTFHINDEFSSSENEINTKSLHENNKIISISIPFFDISSNENNKKLNEEKENIFHRIDTTNIISSKNSSNKSLSINNSNIKSLFLEKKNSSNNNLKIRVFSLIENNFPEKINNLKLIISDFEDSNFFDGKKIEINPLGYDKGFRHQKDGFVFFGTCKENNGVIINDVILNSNLKIKRLFVIFYKNNNFYLKANFEPDAIEENNLFTYLKISENQNLISKKRKNFFQIGNSLFNTEVNERDNSIKIEVNCEKYNNTYHFSPNNYSIITIGRNENNIICLNDKLISKCQCILIYNQNKKNWYIIDGNGYKNSTNGTWKFCNESIILKNSFNYIKIGKSIIEIKKVINE